MVMVMPTLVVVVRCGCVAVAARRCSTVASQVEGNSLVFIKTIIASSRYALETFLGVTIARAVPGGLRRGVATAF